MSQPASQPKHTADVRWDGRGYGLIAATGELYLIRCPECGRENWGPAVASGQCAWCGAQPTSPSPEPR